MTWPTWAGPVAAGRKRPLKLLRHAEVDHAPDEVIGRCVGVRGRGVVDDGWGGIEHVVDAYLHGGLAEPGPHVVATEQIELEVAIDVARCHGEVVLAVA